MHCCVKSVLRSCTFFFAFCVATQRCLLTNSIGLFYATPVDTGATLAKSPWPVTFRHIPGIHFRATKSLTPVTFCVYFT